MTSEPLRSSLRPSECFNGGQVPQIEHEYSVNQSFLTFEWIGLTGKLTNWSPQAPPALSCRPWWPYGYYHDTKKKHSWQQILPENRLCWGRAQVLPETSSISSTRAQEGCWGGGCSATSSGQAWAPRAHWAPSIGSGRFLHNSNLLESFLAASCFPILLKGKVCLCQLHALSPSSLVPRIQKLAWEH